LACYNFPYDAKSFCGGFFSKTMINRESYIAQLNELEKNATPQLIALYGRRRVGKTCLVRYCFQRPNVRYMEVTGLKDGAMSKQLSLFSQAIANCFFEGSPPLAVPRDWFFAFQMLTEQLIKSDKSELRVVFLDELPWLATKRSGLLAALDHYWNTQWSRMQRLIIVVCGSAASWMLDKIINAKGGLHNRLTKIINLKPFDLHETQQFLLAKKMRVSEKNILDLYMVMGGIPYYLEQLRPGKSVAQNINQLCFSQDGLLRTEFPRLFQSLFSLSETNMRIIRVISDHRYGLSRQQIIKKTRIPSGSNLNNRLYELEASGFINAYTPYGYSKKEMYYRVIDEYALFYLRWIDPYLHSGHPFAENHWQVEVKTPAWQSWAGYTFECICLKHSEQILQGLGLDRIGCKISSWRHIAGIKSSASGAQIDLLFDRNDNAITLCEIKYCDKPYVLDKPAAKALHQKRDIFALVTKTRKQLFTALITTLGLKPGLWNDEVIDAVLDLKILFIKRSNEAA
jgi:AAA+ ATPase superfamily predicted ATPase